MDLNELRRRFPNSSDAFLQRNAASIAAFRDSELRPAKSECAKGMPLVGASPGKAKGRSRVARRVKVTYRIFAVRPLDWDNASIKGLQDLLVAAGLLPGDAWHQLNGEVISEKVHRQDEEKTIVEITPCH